MRLNGIIPALTTPFDGGRVAPDRLCSNIERYERTGLTGYLVLGSTGEAVLLDGGERERLLDAARSVIPRGKPIIAGVAAESTAEARRQVETAAKHGADFALLSTPHYFRDQMTGATLAAHFLEVAEEAPIPLLLYNVPKFTGLVLPTEVVADMGRHENIAGLKESSGDPDYLRAVLSGAGEGFDILCGASSLVREALAAGAAGAILAAADVFPEPFVAIARRADETEGLQKAMHEPVLRVAGEHGVPGIKAAMELRGLHGGPPRSPLRPVSAEVRRQIGARIDALADSGLIPDRILEDG